MGNNADPYRFKRNPPPPDPLALSPELRRVTNLLFAYVPKMLSHFIRLETYCAEGFEKQRDDFLRRFEDMLLRSEIYAHPILQGTLTAHLSQLCGIPETRLHTELQILCNDTPHIIERLNNSLSCLNVAFDHALHICARQYITPCYGDPHLKKNDLAQLLLQYGCSRNFIRQTCNIHYRSPIMKEAKTHPGERRTKRDFLTCMVSRERSSCVMLMISFYIDALRVLYGIGPTQGYLKLGELLQKPGTAEIRLPLAVGVYVSVRTIHLASFHSNLKQCNLDCANFPSFEDFYEILGYVLSQRCTVVACIHCNTCYLEFSEEVIDSRALRRIRYMKCPQCACLHSYDLEEGRITLPHVGTTAHQQRSAGHTPTQAGYMMHKGQIFNR